MNHVFVDFENVPDLDPVFPPNIALTLVLFVGDKQAKLRTDLVAALFAHAGQVRLVRLTSSGRNALDFTLAYHLGHTMATDPEGYFHIVSKDHGFDPLVKLLREQKKRVARVDSFDQLPFLPANRPASPALPVAPSDQLLDFVTSLKKNAENRPKRRDKLLTHLKAHLGPQAAARDAEGLLSDLLSLTRITVDAKGRVDYSALGS